MAFEFFSEETHIPLIWIPGGFSLGVLLRFGLRYWPGIILAILAPSYYYTASAGFTLGIAANNTFTAILGAVMLRSVAGFNVRMGRVRDVVSLIVIGAFLMTSASALASTLQFTLVHVEYAWAELLRDIGFWWLSDASGVLLVTPLVLLFPLHLKDIRFLDRGRKRSLELVFVLLCLLVSSILAFHNRAVWGADTNPVTLLPFSCLVWIALRYGQNWASVACFLACLIAVGGTIGAEGTLVGGDLESEAASLWTFIVIATITQLVVSTAVNEMRGTERSLRESESRYRGLFENSPISLWEEDFSAVKEYIDSVRAKGVVDFRSYFEENPESVNECINRIRVIDVNETALTMNAAADKEQLKNNLERLFEEETIDTLREEMITLAEGKRQFEGEMRVSRISGRKATDFIHLSIAPGYEETWSKVFISAIDITERKNAETSLRESETRLQMALESLEGGIWTNLVQENVSYFSPGLRKMLGLEKDEVRNHHSTWEDALHPDEKERVLRALEDHLNGVTKAFYSEHRMKTKTGEWIWVLDRGQVTDWDEEGKPVRMMGTDINITERKRVEELLRSQNQLVEEELEGLKERLVRQTRLAAIGQVAASIAHDLRNPLGAIRNAGFFLRKRTPDSNPVWDEYLEIIEQEIKTSNHIINNLMDMSRSREPVIEQMPLNSAISDAFERIFKNTEVNLRCRLEPETFELSADPNQFRQVLLNLMDNSLQATKGKGNLTIEAKHNGNFDFLTIRNDGPPVPMELRDKIFEPLFTTKAKGTGLGLAIARQIIEGHGGTIGLSDEKGKGTTFYIQLPRVS